MIDTLESNRLKAESLSVQNIINKNLISGNKYSDNLGVKTPYALMTIHRPSKVDNEKLFVPLVRFLCEEVTRDLQLIWAVHPRSRKQLSINGLWDYVMNNPSLILLEPVGYQEMLRLNMKASLMLTDSGGLQEECCVLGTPCITLRFNTERPVTLREYGGASVLTGNNIDRIREEYLRALNLDRKPARRELWDGHTAERIVSILVDTDQNVK